MRLAPKINTLLYASLSLFISCRHEITDPPAQTASTAGAAVTRPNFSAGTVKTYPVQSAVVTTVAGSPNSSTYQRPVSVASTGDDKIWIADYLHNIIICATSAGNAIIRIYGTGAAGSQNGAYNLASFNHPNGLAFGPDGILYITDMYNHLIRTIDPATSTVSTFAGTGIAGFADGSLTQAKFNLPSGIAVDGSGTIYITEEGNNMVRRITGKTTVTRWCGQTTPGSTDAAGANASFNLPRGITVAPDGAVYVADQNNNKIRKIVSGNVTTFAGAGIPQLADGPLPHNAFNHPSALAADSAGNIYVADQNNYVIRLIKPNGYVSTLAGSLPGSSDGYDRLAQFGSPDGITVDPKGRIFITDQATATVRKLTLAPALKTLAGSDTYDYKEGTGADAGFNQISSITMGPDGAIYLAEYADGTRIRKITPDGTTSFIAGNANPGFADGPGSQALFWSSCSLTVTPDGAIYVADQFNYRIRKIVNGIVSTFAGNGQDVDVDGTGLSASFSQPRYIASDSLGNLYTLSFTGTIRRITPAGVVTTVNHVPSSYVMTGLVVDGQGQRYVAADKIYRFAADYAPGTIYSDIAPYGLTRDPAGNLYTASRGLIRTISPNGQWTTLAADPAGGSTQPLDGPIGLARFIGLNNMTVSHNGIVYACEWGVFRVRMLSAQTAL